MKIKTMIPVILLCWMVSTNLTGQTRLIDRAGQLKFYSEAPVENIEATTNQALAVLDMQSAKVAVSILMKSFRFEKALMQEHFNENYIESDKYPKATFSGAYEESVDFDKVGEYSRQVSGELSLHGIKNPIQAIVTFEITESDILVNTKFMVIVADYKIKIPRVVTENISKEVEVIANFKFQKTN